jgi:hypothetical protein
LEILLIDFLKREIGLAELRRVFDFEKSLDGVLNRFITINPDAGHLDGDREYRHHRSASAAADAVVTSARSSLAL